MRALTLALAVGASLAAAAPARAQLSDSTASGPTVAIRAQLDSPSLPGVRWSGIGDVAADLQRAYERRNWEPLWSKGSRPTNAALGVVRFLASVDSLGLDPSDFDAALLDSLARDAVDRPFDEAGLARFEATLSVATARVLGALRWGRVRQPRAYPSLKRSRDDYDIGAGVYAVSRTPDPAVVFDQAGPQWAPYRQLVAALPLARRAAADSLLLPSGPLALHRDSPFAGAPRLRALLTIAGAQADSGAPATGDTLLDASLQRAILRFQKEQGVRETGVFDARTRDAMRAVFRARARDAVLSLERWRWLPRTADGRAIIVNVPEYRLHVYDQVGGFAPPAFSMKTVVGRGDEDRYTPSFTDEVEHLVFSPYWEVPTSIALKEILPKARSDSTYLRRNNYVLLKGYAESAPVVAPDTATIARIGRSIRVRQLPGDYNSLGRVKFMLPNHLNVYLHDTNEKHLFRRADRATSHGCIRVAEPVRLAQWILQGDTAWTPDRMKKAMKAAAPEKVPLASHVPVLIVYHTAAVDERGILRSYKDVYKHDEELQQLLSRGFPYPR